MNSLGEDEKKTGKGTLLISCGALMAGGAERVISILSHPFAEHYDKVTILEWIEAKQFYKTAPNVEIVCIEKECESKSLLRKMMWLRDFVKKEKPDLILSFLYPWSLRLISSLLFTKSKIVVAERQDPRMVRGGLFTKFFRDLLYIKARGILVQTNENIQYYPYWLRKKTSAIYNPIMMDKEMVGSAIRAKKENTICSVGRLSPEKNQILLIEAFAILHREHPEYRLLLYGDGITKPFIEKKVQELELEESVLLLGNVKDVFTKIQSSKLFVLPSKYEGMPNALMEAMCLGLPCISTKVSGSTELIMDGVNGLLVDVDNTRQMADAMERIISDITLSDNLSRQASNLYEITKIEVISKQWVDYIDAKMELK